jgi:hypothetical protein
MYILSAARDISFDPAPGSPLEVIDFDLYKPGANVLRIQGSFSALSAVIRWAG